MRNPAQSTLEYLMSYGWTLIIIVIIIAALVMLVVPPETEISCTGSKNILVKTGRADTEKIQLIIQNLRGTRINGYQVFNDSAYDTRNSPPLFEIGIGDAVVGNQDNSAPSYDIAMRYAPGYFQPLEAGNEKRVFIPWPINGFTGGEFGADGCDFFTNSLGKMFTVSITAYYRDTFNTLREDTINCSGTIATAAEQYFPPSVWGC